jgi:streptogramin lyase
MKINIMNKLVTLFLIVLSVSVFGQNIGIGEWRDELPYRETIAIAVSNDMVYGATPYSMFTLRKADQAMNRYSKINGLSDIGVSTIEYSSSEDVLFIAYTNTNIDLLKDGKIINIPDIKRKQILGKKTINNVYFIGNIAYLSCGFGIVLVDVDREEIKDTWYIGDDGNSIEVFDITSEGNKIYAATEEGIRVGDLSGTNLADFQSWSIINDIPGAEGAFTQIENQQGTILANHHPEDNKDTIWAYQNNSWVALENNQPRKVWNISSGERGFYVSYNYSIGLYSLDFSFERKVYSYQLTDGMGPSEVIEEKDGSYWIADRNNGILNTYDFWGFTNFMLNGPRTANVFDLASSGNRVVVASGGRNDSYANLYKRDGVFTKVDDTWENYHFTDTPGLDTIFDMVCVSVNPINSNQYAIGSWGRGLSTYDADGLVQVYGVHNSSLTPVNGYPKILRVGGVAYDHEGNLWANCAGSNSLMHKMDPSGNWTSWQLGASSIMDVGKMMIDSRDYKWMELRQGGSNYAFVFDENQPSGQQLKGLNGSPNHGNIPGNVVTAIAEDLDGEIWLGTNEGIGVIYNPGNIFNGGDFDAQRIIVERDGYAQYLLGSEKVKAIAIDGANQKWIGTERAGVFLLSSDGLEEIHHFTTENSPLYSDNISAIVIQDNGEVFIGTDKGILVYKGEATPPTPKLDQVYAYPNPVRPDYSGVIAIKGLIRDANIKITDVYGGMVNESKAYGGQAIWDGRNLSGQKVNTGVYMVFISDDQGNDTLVTKILFVK